MYQVYIVDDAVLTRKALVMTIPWNQWGCEVVGAADDGEKALEEIVNLVPDIVITDIRMIRMNGLEMIKKCRESGNNAQFIVISGYNEFEYAQKAIKMDVLDYILKPIDDDELHDAVQRAVERLKEQGKREKENIADTNNKKLQVDYSENNLNAHLRQAMQYVQMHYSTELSVRNVARYLNISESYLTKLFKIEINLTFVEYLTRVRIRKSLEWMKDKNMPIYEIAEKVGYRDYRYFSSTFKKYMGIGPKDYQMYCLPSNSENEEGK